MITTVSETETTVLTTDNIQAENLSIGGNITQHYYGSDRTRLVPVEFGPSDQRFIPPNFFDTLFRKAVEKRIVFISGDEILSKSDLARYLSRELKQHDSFSNMQIVELLRENENQDERKSIADVLEKDHNTHKIVLLYDLHPERIDYNFDCLLEQADEKSCVFIITVDSSLEIWQKAGRMVRDYWFEIPEGRHYSEIQLCDFFMEELRKNPPAFLEDSVENLHYSFLLSPSVSIADVMHKFQSIDRVRLFISHYRSLTEMPGDHKLNELVEMFSQGHVQMIRSWFYQLNHYEKVLALSAALFDGVLIDQYLEAMHEITKSTFWETSDPQLKAVDYFNLSFLDAFFRLETRNDEQYIIRRSASAKQILLDIGRIEYRRHFKTALHEFYTLTRKTYERGKINWELFGTSAKRVWIRRSFTETLRVTGGIEYSLVENHLLELAASQNQFLQAIGAKAMAQWRLYGNEKLLFSTLRTWQRDDEIRDRIEELFKRETRSETSEKVNAVEMIQTTAVMALGYAAYYDQPNQLHEEIIHAMVEFSRNTSTKVMESLQKSLPKFIHHHTIQLQHTIFDELMPVYHLREAIIEGLLLAMDNYPKEVLSAIMNWFSQCVDDPSSLNRRYATTYRDNRLIIILNLLGKLEQLNPELFKSLITDYMYKRYLIPMIANEGRTAVLEHVLKLLAKVQSYDYKLAAQYAQDTIGKLNRSQRLFLVMCWGEIYCSERLDMPGGEAYEHEGRQYPVWTSNHTRPITGIETALYRWMEGDNLQRRFATLVFLELAKSYDGYEQREKLAREIAHQQRLASEQQPVNAGPARMMPLVPSEIHLHIFLRIRIFFYFLFSSNQNKYLLKDTILLFLNVTRYSSSDLEMLIYRWQKSEQANITRKLAKWLKKFL